eukprot:TRINITY_DN3222_c4_g1_i1.p1 TRINITY_DN3222_c4_g1~~TRINITY_DN3222_c4_g1_i1.p1  ORF type:complete len:306 (+),score=26.66 TRINITY_DN3222_c4_g1_i1:107-1024(+)
MTVVSSHFRQLRRVGITSKLRSEFSDAGYVKAQVPLLNDTTIEGLKDAFTDMFKGKFETGVYPDEWHWREGVSKQTACREICQGWKGDKRIARIVLSRELGKAACELMGWEGARIAQDDLVWKPPRSGGVSYHTDAAYISNQFTPRENNSVTIWMPLDKCDSKNGCVEYVRGSHKWPKKDLSATTSEFHGGWKTDLNNAAPSPDYTIELTSSLPGSCIFHHQDVWHGSQRNRSSSRHRRALVCHLIDSSVKFRTKDDWRLAKSASPDYIYGRYKLVNSDELLEDFFPITYTKTGYRTPWLDSYLA